MPIQIDWSKTREQRVERLRDEIAELLTRLSNDARDLFVDEIVPELAGVREPERLVDLYNHDYERKPVDIETFCSDPYFLGTTLRGYIFPQILDDLIELFEGSYTEVLLGGAIGWGKSRMAEIGILYDIYKISCLRNPARAFGLIPGSTLAFVNVSVTKTQAKNVLFGGIFSLARQSPYFRDVFPYERNMLTEIRFPKTVTCYPVAANEQSMLGEGVFSAAFDEMNFMAVVDKSAKSFEGGMYDQAVVLYDRLSRRIKSRMNARGTLPGHVWLISSARYPNDFTERKAQEALQGDDRIFVRQYATWQTKPRNFYMSEMFKVEVGDTTRRSRVLDGTETDVREDRLIEVPMDLHEDFVKDPDNSVKDHAGIAILSIKPFMAWREKIEEMFARGAEMGLKVPFTDLKVTLQAGHERLIPELLPHTLVVERGEDGEVKRDANGKALIKKIVHPGPYCVHIDLAKTQDSCGFAACLNVGPMKVTRSERGQLIEEIRPKIRVALALEIVAPPNGEIKAPLVRGLIYEMAALGMEFYIITYDQFGSMESIQVLTDEGYRAEQYSVDKSTEAYECLKTATYDGRLDCYPFPKLQTEMAQVYLDEKHQKVDHPPHGSKDVSDAVAGAVAHCEELWKSQAMVESMAPIKGYKAERSREEELLWKIMNGIPLTEQEMREF